MKAQFKTSKHAVVHAAYAAELSVQERQEGAGISTKDGCVCLVEDKAFGKITVYGGVREIMSIIGDMAAHEEYSLISVGG